MLLAFPSGVFAADKTTQNSLKEYAPKSSIEDVIKKSKEYAQKQNHDLTKYFIQSTEYDSKEKIWRIFFEYNIPMPGGHFFIEINDLTQEMKFFAGE